MSSVAQVSFFAHARRVHLEGSPITIQNNSYANYHEGTKGGGFKALKAATAHAAFHNSGERHEPPKCHPGTREAILKQIMSWVKGEIDSQTFVYWLNGTVGLGKSAIAQTIAELCEKEGLLLASFFFARSDDTRNNAKMLVTTLAYQVALAVPPVRSYIEQVYEYDPLIDTRSLDTQAAKLLVEPLRRAIADQIHIPTLVVIDGLDECHQTSEQWKVLEIVSRVGGAVNATSRHLVFLIASRPEQEISFKFNSKMLEGVSTTYSIDSKSEDSHSDIHRFLEDGFNEIKNTHPLKSSIPPSWPSTGALLVLTSRADGQFLLATVALSYTSSIKHRPEDRLATILHARAEADENPFTPLDTLYRHICSMIGGMGSLLTILDPRRHRTSPGRSVTAQALLPTAIVQPEAAQSPCHNPPTSQIVRPQEPCQALPSPPLPQPTPPATDPSIHFQSFFDDSFEKLEIIGVSHTQSVHKVRHKETGKIYAMKTIVPRERPVQGLVKGFEDFIRLTKPSNEGQGKGLTLLRCYVAYVDYAKDEVKVVMEFCGGGNLHSVRKRIAEGRGIVGEGVIGKLAVSILDGLAFLHEQGIVHKGVTPFNVLLTKHGAVKLSEVLITPNPAWVIWDKFSVSCLYVSPERILGSKPITGRSDVWSLGITLLEFLWHRHPYPDLPTLDLMARIVQGEPPDIRDEAGISPSAQMKDFFKQLLIVDATSRPDARALKQHPWVVASTRREVNMRRWITDVWGWPRG